MTDHLDTRARRAEGLGHYAGIRNGDLMRDRRRPVPGGGVVIGALLGALMWALALAVALL